MNKQKKNFETFISKFKSILCLISLKLRSMVRKYKQKMVLFKRRCNGSCPSCEGEKNESVDCWCLIWHSLVHLV